MDKVRGSFADVALACSGALVETSTPYNPNSQEAIDGTAKHEALRHVPAGTEPDYEAIAERHQSDADDLRKAVHYGRQAWSEVGQWLPGAQTEVRVEGEVTQGTIDVLSVVLDSAVVDTITVLDWKTGYSGDEHPAQLKAYADAARSRYGMPRSGYITGIEVWTALRERRIRNFTEAELDGFRASIQKQLAQPGRQYASGSHCKWCPRQNQCPARDEYLRATAAVLVPADGTPMAITREVLGTLYERSKLLTSALAAYDKLLREALDEGPITLPDGRVLGLKAVEKDAIEAVKAAKILRAEFGFTDDDLVAVLGATKAGIERVVKGKVSKGGAAGAMRQIMGRLREAEAVSKTTSYQKELTTP